MLRPTRIHMRCTAQGWIARMEGSLAAAALGVHEMPLPFTPAASAEAVLDHMRQRFPGVALAIGGAADPEYRSRIDAERCSLQFGQASGRRLDAGRVPMDESPLFGGERQKELW